MEDKEEREGIPKDMPDRIYGTVILILSAIIGYLIMK